MSGLKHNPSSLKAKNSITGPNELRKAIKNLLSSIDHCYNQIKSKLKNNLNQVSWINVAEFRKKWSFLRMPVHFLKFCQSRKKNKKA